MLAGCATLPPSPLVGPSSLARLPGWEAENHAAALAAVRHACAAAPPERRGRACELALSRGPMGEGAAKAFLESRFRAERIEGEGVLTGYFAPIYEARRAPDGDFSAPVRPPPDGQDRNLARADIDRLPAPDALAWMRPEDLFFLQIQGSGDLAFPDGQRRRAVFAAANGWPFVAISHRMVAAHAIDPADASAGNLHAWLAAHRGPEADAVMREDPRYIYFRLLPDAHGEPEGASGVALIPGRSLAVDPDRHPYFELLWIDAGSPTLSGAAAGYQRLAVALDRGSAIRGEVRADLYVGRGPKAGDEAARVRHTLRLYRILPRDGGPE
jgi:membrane-bound lytic murein transglycosylase A